MYEDGKKMGTFTITATKYPFGGLLVVLNRNGFPLYNPHRNL